MAETTGYPPEMLDPELDLEADLGVDTVKQAEVFAAVRAAFEIPRDDNLKLRDYPTLAAVVGFVRERGHVASAPAPAKVAAPVAVAAPAAAPVAVAPVAVAPVAVAAATRGCTANRCCDWGSGAGEGAVDRGGDDGLPAGDA